MGIWEIICLILGTATGDWKEAFICWIGGYMIAAIAIIFVISQQ